MLFSRDSFKDLLGTNYKDSVFCTDLSMYLMGLVFSVTGTDAK